MDKSFDDLFDEFFEGPKKNTSSKKGDSSGKKGMSNLPDDLPDPIKKIIEALTNGFKPTDEPLNLDKDELTSGTPDEEEIDEENDIKKQTWETDFGSITKITVGGTIGDDESPEDFINRMRETLGFSSSEIFGNKKPRKLTLEEQLQEALDKDTEEGYKEAANIRDLINLRDLEIEKKSKKEKSSESHNEKG